MKLALIFMLSSSFLLGTLKKSILIIARPNGLFLILFKVSIHLMGLKIQVETGAGRPCFF
ncbi:hypothetical protein IV38_GL001475 [Lactobacillus selangorensis]|uniref:Uncharacterized protein n=1 Tax=Lactobacillus selangorensis TaxID=81857 RepID=A0A0R2FTF9_9LACO|nr:hypothetical protein IV38_GL001475 [Lactobacillus selangorensis]